MFSPALFAADEPVKDGDFIPIVMRLEKMNLPMLKRLPMSGRRVSVTGEKASISGRYCDFGETAGINIGGFVKVKKIVEDEALVQFTNGKLPKKPPSKCANGFYYVLKSSLEMHKKLRYKTHELWTPDQRQIAVEERTELAEEKRNALAKFKDPKYREKLLEVARLYAGKPAN